MARFSTLLLPWAFDAQQFIEFQNGLGPKTFCIGHLKPEHAEFLRVETSEVHVYPQTMNKQINKHSDLSTPQYKELPAILWFGQVRVISDTHLCFLYQLAHYHKERYYKVIVKSANDGHELILSSMYKVTLGGYRSMLSRTRAFPLFK